MKVRKQKDEMMSFGSNKPAWPVLLAGQAGLPACPAGLPSSAQ